MRDLHVGRDLTWPAAIASQAVGLLGMRGSGKSNLARVVAEELFASKIPFVIFDPIGNWYGLRAGRDGKPDGGLAIPIFGGEHGDLPLDRTAGAKIADLILDRRLSCVLDLSHPDLSETDKRRFLVEFGERLFRKKSRESGWLDLILEEADDYAPQTTRGGGSGSTAECLGTFQRLIKRGRFKGLGVLMVTQRSAAINKDLLYMVGTLVVFRTTGPRDQDAVAGWVKHNAVNAEVMASLPTLADGEAWVIAPESLGTIARSKFRRMTTYDTGATPEHGGAQAATLADIDVPALSKEFAAASEKAKAEDPRELKRAVAELRAQLARAQAVKPAPVRKVLPAKVREVPILKDAQVKHLEVAIQKYEAAAAAVYDRAQGINGRALDAARAVAREIMAAVAAVRQGGADARTQVTRPGTAAGAGRAARAVPAPHAAERPAPVVSRAPAQRTTPSGNDHVNLGPGRERILAALALHGRPLNRPELGVFSVMSATGGTFNTYLPQLLREGLVVADGNRVRLTEPGQHAFHGPPETITPGSNEALHKAWLNQVGRGGKNRLLGHLLATYPEWITRADLGAAIGMSATGGTFNTYFPQLVRLGLVESNRDGVRATDHLFGFAE